MNTEDTYSYCLLEYVFTNFEINDITGQTVDSSPLLCTLCLDNPPNVPTKSIKSPENPPFLCEGMHFI